MNWFTRIFCRPTLPGTPLTIKLEPGSHQYVLLFDQNTISRATVEKIMGQILSSGIKAQYLMVDDPSNGMSYLKFEVPPSPQASIGETLSTAPHASNHY